MIAKLIALCSLVFLATCDEFPNQIRYSIWSPFASLPEVSTIQFQQGNRAVLVGCRIYNFKYVVWNGNQS